MNYLQAQAFEINIDVLDFLKRNLDSLVKSGLLMPSHLASLNIAKATSLLRKAYLEDKSITKDFQYQDLLNEFMLRIQRARYEKFIFKIASAYAGYKFYLPAFVDFRGRIYRSGVLHFHERDLARGLIVFSSVRKKSDTDINEVYDFIANAAAFHFKKFDTYEDANQWFHDQEVNLNSDDRLIKFAGDAKNPYQFISKVLSFGKHGTISPLQIPITQDASASAYQLISCLLLDKELAKHTNLIPNPEVDKEGPALTFRENEIDQPVYDMVERLVFQKAETYEDSELSGIFIRIYLLDMKDSAMPKPLSDEEIASKIWECINSKVVVEPKETIKFKHSKRRYPEYLTALKPSKRPKQSFIVADSETVLINNVHVPYAAGFLVVRVGDELLSETANQRLAAVVRNEPSIKTVYFHNFSRFDGILILKYLATHGMKYTFIPLMRNNMLYELAIYRGKKLLFRLKDSITLLPSSLDKLAKNLCPELGTKGSIQHEDVQESNLIPLRKELLDYMKQDILLLGGVMQKAQDIYWTQYKVDIVTKLTLSSLALTIFRSVYYNQKDWPIYIPNRNEDSFIRSAYYGGHADTYIPHGENLYYYDVNSLYPYIMKTFPMPGGKPIWDGNLLGQDLDNLFGFIEAYVECPPNIKRPFLPYRDSKRKILRFPTGQFVGVYYSEELKYARDIGYQIMPLKGYLFENKNSTPFGGFVSTLFEKRQEAKKTGNEALSYVYKILMNSLYGRFGINPNCTFTEVCDVNRYNILTKTTDFIFADKLSEHYYIVSYHSYIYAEEESEWKPPRISAVQLAAAVTACARIHMYPYISRPDCYYTDTDSVVLGNPLPEVLSEP
ncbi:hypothetical protein SLEP1_g59819 [Rubroshorea leprosula]|uniref:DNA-directed DNA polymerase n=1 Tax=Rubroshorea leprosula TaxID=152421 RepID=A0AAV5MUK0_9ROSI|nr:hypothetical protein SLEP1_g59819 [Rubroshorea leprosula]